MLLLFLTVLLVLLAVGLLVFDVLKGFVALAEDADGAPLLFADDDIDELTTLGSYRPKKSCKPVKNFIDMWWWCGEEKIDTGQ
ncbi:unnamed protein product [Anisakis simplex]|uniref:Secreted protein n=1 Tax=Anisakis simplex TaxID=6269 RepID=A0A0M3JY31_ANISI|nr:unnamed protein product [Anisakis simplex]